jgi:hypothetical protein
MTMTTAAVQMAVPWHHELSSTCSRKDNGGGGGANFGVSASLAVPPLLAHTMTAAVAVLMMAPWHCQLSLACLRNNYDDDSGNSMNDSAFASFAIPACLLDDNNGSGAARTTVHRHCWLSLTCSRNDSGGGSGMEDGASGSSAVPSLLAQWQQWWRCG